MSQVDAVPSEERQVAEDGLSQEKRTQTVTCGVFDGCKCTICGGHFADGGDDVCANGHQIGHQYPLTA